MTASLEFKRGDTFALDCRVQEYANGSAYSLAGWTVRSQVRRASGVLVSELTVDMTDAAIGRYSLTCDDATGTTGWPIETLMVRVTRDETR
jgi:hypothetical protein